MKKNKKLAAKVVAALAASALCLGVALAVTGCAGGGSSSAAPAASNAAAQGETRIFTDSLGREVEIPAVIERIAPSGHTANQVLLTMAPELMVGLAGDLTDEQRALFGDEVASLPVFGAAFGSKGDLNKEALAAADPQVIIDTGEAKKGLEDDVDALQEQLGIPCVFLETSLDNYANVYTMLGDLLGMPERGDELAQYCAAAYKETSEVMATIPESDRVNMAYLLGDAGLNAIAKDSYQGQVIDMCANNVVVVEKATGSGLGMEVSLEQLAVWNPELIVFVPGSIYDTVGELPEWADIAAIAGKNYYEVPDNPWNWIQNPPTVNQVMGMQYLPRLLYPDKFETSLEDVTKSYYKTFYQKDLTDAELAELLARAV